MTASSSGSHWLVSFFIQPQYHLCALTFVERREVCIHKAWLLLMQATFTFVIGIFLESKVRYHGTYTKARLPGIY